MSSMVYGWQVCAACIRYHCSGLTANSESGVEDMSI